MKKSLRYTKKWLSYTKKSFRCISEFRIRRMH
jgi:hypothetical protein